MNDRDPCTRPPRPTRSAERFDQAFSAGSGLTQRDALAIVRDQRGTGTQTS